MARGARPGTGISHMLLQYAREGFGGMSWYGSRTDFLGHEARKISVVWCLRQGAAPSENKRRAARNTKHAEDAPG